jgi:hypothetical protein
LRPFPPSPPPPSPSPPPPSEDCCVFAAKNAKDCPEAWSYYLECENIKPDPDETENIYLYNKACPSGSLCKGYTSGVA